MMMIMMMRGDVCATYLIDEPLFVPICLLSYSINSSSRAAAFSESIQNSFLSGDICGLLRWRCDFAGHIPFFSVMRRTRTLMVSSFRSSGMCWQLPKGKHIGTGLSMILKSVWSNIHFHLCCCIDVTKNATYDVTLTMLTSQNWFLFGPEERFGCKASIMTAKLHY